MITIHDNRRTDDVRLFQIEVNGYFMFGDVLCRRVSLADAFRINYNGYSEDGIPYVEVPCGRVDLMDRNTWVLPIRDEQIEVCIEDWG